MIVPPYTMLLTTTDIRTSDSTGLYSYQVVGSTRSQQPEAYGKVLYSNNVLHGASVQNMQLVEYIEEVSPIYTFPVLSQFKL